MAQENEKNEQYKKMLSFALERLDMYAPDWTSRLPSDPGVTILENLTAFVLLLYEEYGTVPERVREHLAALFGIRKRTAAQAEMFLSARDRRPHEAAGGFRHIRRYQKFRLGQYCFEPEKEMDISAARLTELWREGASGERKRLWRAADGDGADGGANAGGSFRKAEAVFGEHPRAGDSLYLLFDGPCALPGETFFLYVEMDGRFPRTEAPEGMLPDFAQVQWSYSTDSGYCGAWAQDKTGAFLKSGGIEIRLGAKAHERQRFGKRRKWILKCTLIRQQYDYVPYFRAVYGPLFRVVNRDTKIVSSDSPSGKNVDYVSRDAAVHSILGVLGGCDDQEFPVGIPGEPVPQAVEIMVETGKSGEKQRRFFRPADQTEGAVVYEYDSGKHAIVVSDAGNFEGWKVSLSGWAVFDGADGNVCSSNVFISDGQTEYFNPSAASCGRDREDESSMLTRLRREMESTGVLVTAEDYKRAALETPGLSIQKANAFREQDGTVCVCVKPYSDERLPTLPPLYRDAVRAWLDEKRLLGTRLTVRGARYIPVSVHANITVKLQYARCREEIEEVIRRDLEHVTGEQTFGSTVSVRRLKQQLTRLACVEAVEAVYITAGGEFAEADGAAKEEVTMPKDGLCYAGDIRLELKKNRIL